MAVYVHIINEGASLLLERWDQAPFPVGSSQVGLDDDHDAVVFPGEAVEDRKSVV